MKYRGKHVVLPLVALTLLLTLLAGCGQGGAPEDEALYIDSVELSTVEIADEGIALSELPAISNILMPAPSGVKTEKNTKAVVDYSNTSDGYVMVQFTASTTRRLKARVFGPNTNTEKTCYTYDLTPSQWTTFPLADGSGKYKVVVYEGTGSSGKYAPVLTASFSVTLTDEFAPFIRPNQYVDYSEEISPNTLAKAEELIGDVTDPLEKVRLVYEFVVQNLKYDTAKANDVKDGKLTGYLPVLDDVLEAKKGICFDYAALMSGMLRSQGVPCKLVTGYAGTAFHAWISVWTEEDGWVDGAIYFDGTTWHRMDPTYASSGKGSNSIMKFIGDGSNYTVKRVY